MNWSVLWIDIFLLKTKEEKGDVCTNSSIEEILLEEADGVTWQWSECLSSFLCSHWHSISTDEVTPTPIHVARFWPMGNFNIVQFFVDVRGSLHDEPDAFVAQERCWQRVPSKSGKQSQRNPFTASTHVPTRKDRAVISFLFESKVFLPLFKHDRRSQSTISILHVSPVMPGAQRHFSARHWPKTHVRGVHLP